MSRRPLPMRWQVRDRNDVVRSLRRRRLHSELSVDLVVLGHGIHPIRLVLPAQDLKLRGRCMMLM
jgi:hypothetical protein